MNKKVSEMEGKNGTRENEEGMLKQREESEKTFIGWFNGPINA